MNGPEVAGAGVERVIVCAEDLALAIGKLSVADLTPFDVARLRLHAQQTKTTSAHLLRICDSAASLLTADNERFQFHILPGKEFGERFAGDEWRPIIVPEDVTGIYNLTILDDRILACNNRMINFADLSISNALIDIFNTFMAMRTKRISAKDITSRAQYWGPRNRVRNFGVLRRQLNECLYNLTGREVIRTHSLNNATLHYIDPNLLVIDARSSLPRKEILRLDP